MSSKVKAAYQMWQALDTPAEKSYRIYSLMMSAQQWALHLFSGMLRKEAKAEQEWCRKLDWCSRKGEDRTQELWRAAQELQDRSQQIETFLQELSPGLRLAAARDMAHQGGPNVACAGLLTVGR